MQKLMTLKFAFFAAALTVYAFPVAASCSDAVTESCSQKVTQVEDCACPASMGRGEECFCPEVVTTVKHNPNGCIQAASPRKQHERVAYTLDPRPEEFDVSSRRNLFEDEEVQETEDRDGSIFGGGPCKTCSKDGSIFGGGPCKTCSKDGSIFGGGPCKTCNKNGSIFGGAPCQGPNCVKEKTNPKYIQNYVVFDDSLYNSVHHECGNFAPLQLEWVDFRIKKGMTTTGYSRKLGKYRFRIFGCRRNNKTAILNEGRILEKDMNFVEIFDDKVSDCYNIVKIPNDLCLKDSSPLPEYVLTAEITDYYMNLCDEYNWDEAKNAEKRIGSSEMKVVWRLMDLNKTNVLWKGQSTGYGEVQEGEYNGEIVLIQRAFADAVDNLRNLSGFEDQLAQRLSPEEMQRQRQSLIDLQRQMDPVKCQFSQEIKIMEDSGVVSSGYGMNEGWINVPETQKEIKVIENSGLISAGSGAAGHGDVSSIQMLDGAIVENSGLVEAGSGAVESGHVTSVEMQNGKVIENSGLVSDGSAISTTGSIAIGKVNAAVVEDSGQVVDGAIVVTEGQNAKENNGMVENAGVTATGSALYEVEAVEPLSSDMSALFEKEKLCIKEQPDYENMGPENVYKVRTAVVSVTNAKGQKGAGLIVSEQFVMTSADLIDRKNNSYALETINGKKLKARAFRINPKKNTALLVLNEPTKYVPLSLNLTLPAVEKDNFMTLGLLNFEAGESEGYLETGGKVTGYRYDADGTAQIVIDTFVQTATIGGVLIDEKGRITGMAHTSRLGNGEQDLFLPIETAMKSLGVEICGKAFPIATPKPQKAWRQKSVAPLIENTNPKAPEVMKVQDRK